jgi:hypothetical protein
MKNRRPPVAQTKNNKQRSGRSNEFQIPVNENEVRSVEWLIDDKEVRSVEWLIDDKDNHYYYNLLLPQ